MQVRSVELAEKNPTDVTKWINAINELHRCELCIEDTMDVSSGASAFSRSLAMFRQALLMFRQTHRPYER